MPAAVCRVIKCSGLLYGSCMMGMKGLLDMLKQCLSCFNDGRYPEHRWESASHVCLGSVGSDKCMSGGLEFMTKFGGRVFIAHRVLSVSIGFVIVIVVVVTGICE